MVLKEDQENATNGKQKGQCSREDSCSFGHDKNKRAKSTPKSTPLFKAPTENGGRSVLERKTKRPESVQRLHHK